MEASKHDHEGACKGLSSNYGSEQANRRDIERACKGARPQINDVSKRVTMGHVRACPQIK